MSVSPVNLLAKIDACEAYLLRAADGAPVDWRTFLREIAEARSVCTGDHAPLSTVLDELQLLAHVLAPGEVPSGDLESGTVHDARFGYGIRFTSDREALFPSFARALLSTTDARALANALPGLALGDYSIWHEIAQERHAVDNRKLALLWLTSPARRLAWDLSALDRIGRDAMFSIGRVLAAVGDPDVARPPVDVTAWPPVYECTPLRPIAIDDSDATVVRALRALAAPEWLWSRSQAIGALLGRAATNPAYIVQGFTSDLREELPARLGATFAVPDDEPTIELERELLRVASSFGSSIDDEAQIFALARWLGYVLVKSPFYANDPHVLAATLSSVGRDTPSRPSNGVFHPRRILSMLGTDLANWRAFVVSIGAALHYLSPASETRLDPVPVTLVEELWRIAARTLTTAEIVEETAAADRAPRHDVFRRHLAPPWIARATLHRMRSPWVSRLDPAAFAEVLAAVDADPLRYGWVTESIARASRLLDGPIRQAVAAWWGRVEPSDALPAHQLVLVASSALREVVTQGQERLDNQVSQAAAVWRPFLAHTLAAEAHQLELPDLEMHFVEQLARFGSDGSLPLEQRQRALAWWLQRLQNDRKLLTPPVEARLRALIREPVVTSNPRLRLVFDELGISDRPSRRGEARR